MYAQYCWRVLRKYLVTVHKNGKKTVELQTGKFYFYRMQNTVYVCAA